MKRYTTIEDVNTISGFFTQYKARKSEHYTTLFGDTDSVDLDNLLTDIFGMRVYLEQYEKIFLNGGAESLQNRLISACDLLYYEQWKSVKETIDKVLNEDVSTPYTEIKKIKENRNGENESVTQNKTNAFDETETPTDTDRAENNGNDKLEIKRTEKTDKSNGKTASENATEKLDFTKYNDFLEIVLNDITNFCTIAIAI